MDETFKIKYLPPVTWLCGGETRVCVDDIERNLGANGPLEMLDVAYDNETDDVTIFCNEFEH